MEAETFERSLRAFARRTPFQPFMVELVSGTRLLVEHPEALVFQSRVAVYFHKDSEITHFDNNSVTRMTTDIDATTAK